MGKKSTTHLLIGCSKTKQQSHHALPPAELYTGQLFQLRLKYAELREVQWAVLSGKYGLVHPGSRRKYYDEKISDQCKLDRASWPLDVANFWLSQFDDYRIDPRDYTVELHCGKDYAHPLADHFRLAGVTVELPVEGLGIGQQLQWYRREIDRLNTEAIVTALQPVN